MMRYDIDEDGIANLEVSGSPIIVARDICTLIDEVVEMTEGKVRTAFLETMKEWIDTYIEKEGM